MTPLESEDIAAAIVYAVTQLLCVNVRKMLVRPTDQERSETLEKALKMRPSPQ
jgi:NADP-dependent 3-hydroxy acid dehydrogenase YdfG